MANGRTPPSEVLSEAAVEGHLARANSKELLARLQKLFKSITKVEASAELPGPELARELTSPSVVRCKNKEVRLLCACCLVDVLRICAPTSPFSGADLHNVFRLLTQQLDGITSSTGSVEAARRFHVLETLSTVKSPVLLLDSDDDSVLQDLVTTLFRVVGRGVPQVIENAIFDIAVSIIEDANSVPNFLLEILFNHLSMPEKNEKCFDLTKRIICLCRGQLDAPIADFVNAVVAQSTTVRSRSQQLEIIFRLATIDPALLRCVLPKLQDALDLEDESERLLFVRLFGRIFTSSGSVLAKEFSQLFAAFLKRMTDISESVRCEVVQVSSRILENSSDFRQQISSCLRDRGRDHEQSVRSAVIDCVCTVALARPDVIDSDLLRSIGERMLDKKPAVRQLTMQRMAELFSSHCARYWGEAKPVPLHCKKFSWIPQKILSVLAHNLPDRGFHVHRIVDRVLLNAKSSVKERTHLLLAIFATCDERNRAAFLNRFVASVASAQGKLSEILSLREQIRTSDDEKGNEKRKLQQLTRIQSLVEMLPVGTSPELMEELLRFENQKLFKHLQVLCDPASPYTRLRVTAKDFSKALAAPSKSGIGKKLGSFGAELVTLVAATVIGGDNVPLLCALVEQHASEGGNRKLAQYALSLLQNLAQHQPSAVRPHIHHIVVFLDENSMYSSDIQLSSLQILSGCVNEPDQSLSGIFDVLRRYCTSGSSEEAANAAKILITLARDERLTLETVLQDCTEELRLDNENLLPHLATLSAFCKLAPELFENERDDVVKFVKNQVLSADQIAYNRPTKKQKQLEEKLSVTTLAKALGIELLVNYLLGLPAEDEYSVSAALPVLQLLLSLIREGGDLGQRKELAADEARHITVAAASALLQLLTRAQFERLFSPSQFARLALLAQAEDLQSRQAFFDALWQHLIYMRLPFHYAVIFALAGTDPAKELLSESRRRFQLLVSRQRSLCAMRAKPQQVSAGGGGVPIRLLPEFALVYLIHLLSHHPELDGSELAYRHFAKYLSFFFDGVCRQAHHNYDLLLVMLVKIRSCQDATDLDNAGIYSLAELCQLLLKRRYQNQHWSREASMNSDSFSLPPLWYTPIQVAVQQRFLPSGFDIRALKRATSPPPESRSQIVKARTPKKTPSTPSTPKRRSRARTSTPSSSSASAGSTGRSRRSLPRRTKSVPSIVELSSADEEEHFEDEEEEEEEFEDPLSLPQQEEEEMEPASSPPPPPPLHKDEEVEATKENLSPPMSRRSGKKKTRRSRGGKKQQELDMSSSDEVDEENVRPSRRNTARPNKLQKKADDVEEDGDAERRTEPLGEHLPSNRSRPSQPQSPPPMSVEGSREGSMKSRSSKRLRASLPVTPSTQERIKDNTEVGEKASDDDAISALMKDDEIVPVVKQKPPRRHSSNKAMKDTFRRKRLRRR